MRISDWSSDVCSSDLAEFFHAKATAGRIATIARGTACFFMGHDRCSLIYAAEPRIRAQASFLGAAFLAAGFFAGAALSAAASFFGARSEEHTSELQSLMRRSYAFFCLKKKKQYYAQKYRRTINIIHYHYN